MYLNCDQGVGLEKTVAVADGEIEGRLHYVSWFDMYCVCQGPCMYYCFATPNKPTSSLYVRHSNVQ